MNDVEKTPKYSHQELLHEFTENMKTHTLVKYGHTIKIHEMIHIGPEEFYDMKNEQIADDYDNGMIIHHEGVSLLPKRFMPSTERFVNDEINEIENKAGMKSGYGKLASLMGFVYQKKPTRDYIVNDITWEDMTGKERFQMLSFGTAAGLLLTIGSYIVNNHLNENQKQQVARKFVHAIVQTMRSNTGTLTGILKSLKPLILDKRNEIATAKAMESLNDVVMVWGKTHAKDFIKIFENNGYRVVT